MKKFSIPKDAGKKIDDINSKIESTSLGRTQYQVVYDAYKRHIFGDASDKNPKKKEDYSSFFTELSRIFRFSNTEIEFLVEDSTNGSATALFVAQKILHKDEAGLGQLLYEEIMETEFLLDRGLAYMRKNK